MARSKAIKSRNRLVNPYTWVVIGICIVMLYMGLYTGFRIYYYVFSLILIMLLISAVTNFWVLFNFKYTHTISKKFAVKGDVIELDIEIHNEKPFLYPKVVAIYDTPSSIAKGQPIAKEVSLLPFSRLKIHETIECNLRGSYNIGLKKVIVSDMFGFFTFNMMMGRRTYHHMLSLDVMPRILYIDQLKLPHMEEEAAVFDNMKLTDQASVISDLRNYRFGDSLKRIHWKATAKLQEVFIKNYETNTMPEAQMYIDTKPYPIKGMARFEVEDNMVECATAIAQYMVSKGINLSVITYQGIRENVDGFSFNDFDKFYAYLAALRFNGEYHLENIIDLEVSTRRAQKIVMLLVYEIDNNLFNKVSILQKQGIDVYLFLLSHSDYLQGDEFTKLSKLMDNGIICHAVFTGQRIDTILRGNDYD